MSNIAAFDLKDLASTAVVLILIIAGLMGQVLEKRKGGKKKAAQRKVGPPVPRPPPRIEGRPVSMPARGSPPPPPKEQEEEITVIRLPNGQVIATVRKARPKTQARVREAPPPKPAPPRKAKPLRAKKAAAPVSRLPLKAPHVETPKQPVTQTRPQLGRAIAGRGREVGQPEPPKPAEKVTAKREIARLSFTRSSLRQAVILSEVFQPPLALRDRPPGPPF